MSIKLPSLPLLALQRLRLLCQREFVLIGCYATLYLFTGTISMVLKGRHDPNEKPFQAPSASYYLPMISIFFGLLCLLAVLVWEISDHYETNKARTRDAHRSCSRHQVEKSGAWDQHGRYPTASIRELALALFLKEGRLNRAVTGRKDVAQRLDAFIFKYMLKPGLDPKVPG
ncbi:hypothetical protein B0J17DRAFT_633642 [Rhizoctonia solani]|nr:hypothetical protein B0J17DRAFT_633642 [Rhizoctonia solani]